MAHLDDTATQRANQTFMRRAMRMPLLEREDEFALARRWRDQRDERALHQLVEAYSRLVVAAAHKFKHYGLPLGDLMQEGEIGLLQAAERFDPERDIRFSTYAAWWIRAAIQDYVLRNWSIVRTGTTAAQKSLFFNLRRLRNKLAGVDGKLTDAGRQKIATTLGVSFADVIQMDGRLNGGDMSLNLTINADSPQEAQDFLVDERPTPETQVMNHHDGQVRNRWLQQALSTLDGRERQIILRRKLDDDGVTLEDLGAEMGVSKERVRQLENRALGKLKLELSRFVKNPADLWGDA
jgi:RNA polymerase sigma-32 factor